MLSYGTLENGGNWGFLERRGTVLEVGSRQFESIHIAKKKKRKKKERVRRQELGPALRQQRQPRLELYP